MTRHNGSQVALDNLPLLMVKLRSWLLNTQTGLTDHSLLPRDCGDGYGWLSQTIQVLHSLLGARTVPQPSTRKLEEKRRKILQASASQQQPTQTLRRRGAENGLKRRN